MSLLGDEKASERGFKISGKFTGGVGSSGTWSPASAHTHGNDWEAEARYNKKLAAQPQSIGQRLAAAQKKESLGAEAPKPTVEVPGARKETAKAKAVAAAKEAARVKAQSLLSPRAKSEAARLKNLFTK